MTDLAARKGMDLLLIRVKKTNAATIAGLGSENRADGGASCVFGIEKPVRNRKTDGEEKSQKAGQV